MSTILQSNPLASHPSPIYASTNSGGLQAWTPIITSSFDSKPSSFILALEEMYHHPEHNTTWILRSDTLYDSASASGASILSDSSSLPVTISISNFNTTRSLVRRFVPRNSQRDKPATQSCIFLSSTDVNNAGAAPSELVVYIVHCDSAAQTPYYLPKVRGVGWLLSVLPKSDCLKTTTYTITLLYNFFAPPNDKINTRLERTALHLSTRAKKLASGIQEGYIKRVHHDQLVPRETFQDLYMELRHRHAPRLVAGWVEKTDPVKHVFEDILIATFLICLWEQMYPQRRGWVGFVDIGCGNGVLVDILVREGWEGTGFDARRRKSWEVFGAGKVQEKIMIPFLLGDDKTVVGSLEDEGIHDGVFENGTFIVSNHADELTPWTPILAAANSCPFLAIPCCSHDLSGAKKRFPPPSELINCNDLRINRNFSKSTYASLVAYVEKIAHDCGWVVEREVLRIPSTRNVGIVGRTIDDTIKADIREIVEREGGGLGWRERIEALRKPAPVGTDHN
jgi:tRNASer (uridine44-2'-O)-methyltransferase